ncbi:MAG: hypothetical protein OXO49_05005 [Gammaproteobacteria bacterium]|nr:hypothetical protein [Gammaproteobacteria bacterium]MDE0093849.1 hypothetical protein [Gammaproteobacteria bacterium]MDE0252345.1 hypothetical protein [Gammaproteobacteria bacterium]MDE0402546.1 hypothetical protein [Gammaproteobacteria bacterium]MYF54142.1 hypothetical protein [Gammaproteobacteria bacterium]
MVRISRVMYPRHSLIALGVMIGFVLALLIAELALHQPSALSDAPAEDQVSTVQLVSAHPKH